MSSSSRVTKTLLDKGQTEVLRVHTRQQKIVHIEFKPWAYVHSPQGVK